MQSIFNCVEEDFLSSRSGDREVCYLKAEGVAVGGPAAWEAPWGGEEEAAWAPGPAAHLSAAAALPAACQWENLEKASWVRR